MNSINDVKAIVKRGNANEAARILQYNGLRRDGFYPLIFSSDAREIASTLLAYSARELVTATLNDEFAFTLIDHIGMLVEITAIIDNYADKTMYEYSSIPEELRTAIRYNDYYPRLEPIIEKMDKTSFRETLAFIAKEPYAIHCGFAPSILRKMYREETIPKEQVLFLMTICLKQPFDVTYDVYNGYPDFVKLRGETTHQNRYSIDDIIGQNPEALDVAKIMHTKPKPTKSSDDDDDDEIDNDDEEGSEEWFDRTTRIANTRKTAASQ